MNSNQEPLSSVAAKSDVFPCWTSKCGEMKQLRKNRVGTRVCREKVSAADRIFLRGRSVVSSARADYQFPS